MFALLDYHQLGALSLPLAKQTTNYNPLESHSVRRVRGTTSDSSTPHMKKSIVIMKDTSIDMFVPVSFVFLLEPCESFFSTNLDD